MDTAGLRSKGEAERSGTDEEGLGDTHPTNLLKPSTILSRRRPLFRPRAEELSGAAFADEAVGSFLGVVIVSL
jgi:hypothetical protein